MIICQSNFFLVNEFFFVNEFSAFYSQGDFPLPSVYLLIKQISYLPLVAIVYHLYKLMTYYFSNCLQFISLTHDFDAKIKCLIGTPLSQLLYPCDICQSFFFFLSTSLISSKAKYNQLILYLAFHKSANSKFKKHSFLFVGNNIRDLDLSVKFSHYMLQEFAHSVNSTGK